MRFKEFCLVPVASCDRVCTHRGIVVVVFRLRFLRALVRDVLSRDTTRLGVVCCVRHQPSLAACVTSSPSSTRVSLEFTIKLNTSHLPGVVTLTICQVPSTTL